MKKIVYIVTILIVGFYSCVDPYAADSTYIKDTSALSAASYMERTDSLNVSMWVQLLKYTDLFNTLNLAANYTCFVPSNDAMKAYLTKKGVANVTDLNIDDAKLLVKYHTIKGTLYSSVSFEEGVIPDTTATGDYLSTSFEVDGGAVRINTEATITKTVKTNNAYIHVLNATLTPVTETIWDKLQSSDFSIFRQAVIATRMDTALSKVTDFISLVKHTYHYTLFAVPDSVYKANNINSFQTLCDSLKSATDYTSTTNALNLYVNYHLLNQQISYATLANFSLTDTKRSKNYSTMATNQLFNISEVSKILYINYSSTTGKGAKFLSINKNCKNGVVHIISDVMRVQVPKLTTIVWEFTDYPILASTLSKYRVSGLTSQYTSLLSPTVATCYKWLSIPDSKPGLTYVVANKNETESYKAINYDYLLLNLGTYGWVEMTTPSILAGKYTITFGHYNLIQPATIGKVGKLWFIVDGAYVGTQPVTTQGANTTKSAYTTSSVGTVTFTTTGQHKVRILAADTYSSYIDCLTFTP